MKKTVLSVMTTIILLSPSVTFAQGFDFVNVKLNPKTPGTNQDVTVSLDSFATDLDSSAIVWYVNKVPMKQGVGVKSIMVHTGEFGETQIVEAVIVTNLGKRIEKVINVSPSEIDFLWEAQTYTPPFYKGKAMPTYNSIVKVTAIPRYNQAASDPMKFFYSWKYNNTLTVGQGLGKNSALIQMGFPNSPVPVNVDVSLPNTDWTGQHYANVSGAEAKVLFYEQAPLLGINFNKALTQTTQGTGNQFTVKAVPYFFSTSDVDDGMLVYTWRANRANIVPGLDPTVITLTKIGQGDEKFNTSLKIQTPRHVLQEGSALTTIDLPADQ